jgi:hypothetical protein
MLSSRNGLDRGQIYSRPCSVIDWVHYTLTANRMPSNTQNM